MNKTGMITASLSFAALVLGAGQPQAAMAQSHTPTITLAAKAPCGGENQDSCWSPNPKNWCNAGLQYTPGGIGRRGKCIRPPQSAPVADRDDAADCGGLGQDSCWSPNPTKWCNSGLQYVPGGIARRGKCLKPPQREPVSGSDPTPNCGGVDQSSCWSLNSKKWCDEGLLYRPGGLPGRGRCEEPKSGDMIDQTRAMASRYAALDKDNELARLRSCVNSPRMKVRMIAAMKSRSTNTTNTLLRECDINPVQLQQVATSVLGDNSGSARSTGYRSDTGNPPDTGLVRADGENPVSDKFRLFMELSAGAASGSKDQSFTIGYAIPLHSKANFSRWYKNSMDYSSGFDLGVGADIFVGLGKPGVPSGDNVTETGTAGIISIAALAKLGLLGRMTQDGEMSFGLFGGVGLGVTAASYDYTNEYFSDIIL